MIPVEIRTAVEQVVEAEKCITLAKAGLVRAGATSEIEQFRELRLAARELFKAESHLYDTRRGIINDILK